MENKEKTKKKEDIEDIFKNNHICSECKEYFVFKFYDNTLMSVECKCIYIKVLLIEEFCKKYTSQSKPGGCGKHKDEKGKNKKYKQYCKDCKEYLCKDCLKEKAEQNNDTGKITKHETHDLIGLLEKKKEMEKYKKITSINNNYINNKGRLKIIIKNIIDNFDEYPSYHGLKTIKNITKLLENYGNIKYSKEIIENKILKKITSIKDLKEKINSSNSIYKITIEGDDKDNKGESLENLNIFKGKDFNELKKLHMDKINLLKDISALSNCGLINLTKLII